MQRPNETVASKYSNNSMPFRDASAPCDTLTSKCFVLDPLIRHVGLILSDLEQLTSGSAL